MRRRGFLATAIAGAAGVKATAGAGGDGGTGLVRTPPVVMAPRSDGAEIVWAVSRRCRGWVELAEDDAVRRVAADDWGFVPQGEKVLRVRIEGVGAGAKCRYRVVTEAMEGEAERVESDWREFRTLDPAAAETRFVVWNDTHQHDETIRRLDEVTPAADFLLWNGDTCNDWHKEELIVPTILHPGGTDFSAKRPVAMAWGNHDVRGAFGFRVADYVAAPDGRPYYAFRSGPVAVVVLHTGEDKPDEHPSFKGRVAFDALRREQAAWLESEVMKRPELRDAPLRMVFCHIPLRWTDEVTDAGYDWFSKRSRDLWHDALVKWGAQVVVSGHTHRVGWLDANDQFPYAQLVGGGPKPGQAAWIEGRAGKDGLRLIVRNLAGKVLEERVFPRLG